MNIKRVVVGELEENCYIVEKENSCIIIDPGDEAEKIIESIDKEVKGILITHYHFDHIGALTKLKEKYNIEENNFNIDGFDFEVIKTPGHTSDSLTFYFKKDKIMFVGDFIFNRGIGRVDLPTGDMREMVKSLNKIFTYPLDTIIYPGHGELSTLRDEKNFIEKYFL